MADSTHNVKIVATLDTSRVNGSGSSGGGGGSGGGGLLNTAAAAA